MADVTPGRFRRVATGGVLGAVASIVALALVHTGRPGLRLEFREDHPPPPGVTLGFSAATSVDGAIGARTSTRGDLRLHGIDRRTGWHVRARLRAPAPGRRVALEADARPLATLAVPPNWIEATADVPPSTSRSALVFSLHTLDEITGNGMAGIYVDRLEILPTGWARPPTAALWSAGVTGVLLGASLAAWGLLALAASTAVVAAVSAVQSIALTDGLGSFAALPATVTIVDLQMAAIVGLCWILGRVLGLRAWSVPTRWAVLATTVCVHLSAFVLLHPGVTNGDARFHAHRFNDVIGGHWLFTSSGPGGDFPYAVGLYVIALPLRAWQPETATLLRLIVIVATAVAGLLVYAAAAKWWEPRAGLVALLLVHLLPQNLNVQGTAFLTNAFANALSAAALAVLAVAGALAGYRRWTLLLLGAAFALGATLSHLSSGVILLATLGVAGVLLIALGPRHRTLGLATLATLCLVAAVAWGLYYRHFGDVYRGLLSPPPSPTEASPQTPPQMRTEAHQTRYVPGAAARRARAAAVPRYAVRYFGVAGLSLGAIGLFLALRQRDNPLAVIAVAWALTCAGFLALGVLTPVDLRYYLAAFPVVALLAGLAATDWCRRGGLRRMAAGVLCIAAFIEGAWAWWRWLGTPDL